MIVHHIEKVLELVDWAKQMHSVSTAVALMRRKAQSTSPNCNRVGSIVSLADINRSQPPWDGVAEKEAEWQNDLRDADAAVRPGPQSLEELQMIAKAISRIVPSPSTDKRLARKIQGEKTLAIFTRRSMSTASTKRKCPAQSRPSTRRTSARRGRRQTGGG